MVQLGIFRMDFLCFQKCSHDFFLQKHPCIYKTLTSTTKSWLVHFYANMEHQTLGKGNNVCYFKEPVFFLLVLSIVPRNYKIRKVSLFPCKYKCNFRFPLKLTNTALQKLATFYMFNEKQKHDGMDENTLLCCYGDYVTTNQST